MHPPAQPIRCPHCQREHEFPATSQQRQFRRRAECQSRMLGVEISCRHCRHWFTWQQPDAGTSGKP